MIDLFEHVLLLNNLANLLEDWIRIEMDGFRSIMISSCILFSVFLEKKNIMDALMIGDDDEGEIMEKSFSSLLNNSLFFFSFFFLSFVFIVLCSLSFLFFFFSLFFYLLYILPFDLCEKSCSPVNYVYIFQTFFFLPWGASNDVGGRTQGFRPY